MHILGSNFESIDWIITCCGKNQTPSIIAFPCKLIRQLYSNDKIVQGIQEGDRFASIKGKTSILSTCIEYLLEMRYVRRIRKAEPPNLMCLGLRKRKKLSIAFYYYLDKFDNQDGLTIWHLQTCIKYPILTHVKLSMFLILMY